MRRPDIACLLILVVYVITIHSGLLSYDLISNFAPFLRADRALQRAEAISRLLNASTYPEIRNVLISNSIIPGEYLLQAALYSGGGALGIVLFQVVLQLIAVVGVFRIALLVFDSAGPSLAAALLYATLPHSLVLTHQLSSEAIAVPLVVIGYWLFLEFRIADKSPGLVIAAGAVLGVSALVRPVLALLPLVNMPFAARNRSRRNIAVALGFGAVGMLPLLLCVAFFWFSAHELSLGNTSDSLEYNLYLQVARVARSVEGAEAVAISDRYLDRNGEHTLPIPEYISFVIHYPAASLRHHLRDMVTLATKSGVSKLTLDYFNLAPEALYGSTNPNAIQADQQGWRSIWESRGLLAAIQSVVAANPVIAVVELLGAACFSLLFASFLIGMIAAARRSLAGSIPIGRRVGFHVLTVHALYIFASAQVADAAQSRLRHPAEFAMCILAVLGAMKALAFYRGHRGSRTGAADSESNDVEAAPIQNIDLIVGANRKVG